MYGVHRTCAETAAVSCGTSHASAVSTPLRWILKKTRYKKLVTHVEPHASAVSLLKRAENSAIYKRPSINPVASALVKECRPRSCGTTELGFRQEQLTRPNIVLVVVLRQKMPGFVWMLLDADRLYSVRVGGRFTNFVKTDEAIMFFCFLLFSKLRLNR